MSSITSATHTSMVVIRDSFLNMFNKRLYTTEGVFLVSYDDGYHMMHTRYHMMHNKVSHKVSHDAHMISHNLQETLGDELP